MSATTLCQRWRVGGEGFGEHGEYRGGMYPGYSCRAEHRTLGVAGEELRARRHRSPSRPRFRGPRRTRRCRPGLHHRRYRSR